MRVSLARRRALNRPRLPSAYDTLILAGTPVAFWKLAEASGTTAADSSGNSHDGTYTGGVTLGQPGISGSDETAATFDGSSGRVLIPTPLSGFGTFSIEAWINLAALPGSYCTPVSIGGGQSGTTTGGASFRIWSDGAVHFLYPNVIDSASGLSVTAGGWHHLALTRDGTTSKMYVDGAVGSGTIANAPNNSGQSSQIASQEENAPADWFDGTIQYVAVYNTTLSAGQVAAHHTAGL